MSPFSFVMRPVLLDKDGNRIHKKEGAREAYRANVSYAYCGGNRHPHFAITCDGYRRVSRRPSREESLVVQDAIFMMDSCGCQHDVVKRLYPSLEPFLKWHLCDPEGPMHYIANSVYRWEQWLSASLIEPAEDVSEQAIAEVCARAEALFKDTCVWGTVPGDEAFEPRVFAEAREVREWLEERLPALSEAFLSDLEKVKLLNPRLELQGDAPAT